MISKMLQKARDFEKKYLKSFPEMKGKYSFHLCKSADGIGASL